MGLREKVKEFSNLLPFMEGRTKADFKDLLGTNVTITDFGFMQDEENKEYVAFTVKEDSAHFYFGGMVLTENLKDLNEEESEELRKDGLPVLFTEKLSKNKRTYTVIEYYPTPVVDKKKK